MTVNRSLVTSVAISSEGGILVGNKNCAWRLCLAVLALSATGAAKADWLAADPGTPISLTATRDGIIIFGHLAGPGHILVRGRDRGRIP